MAVQTLVLENELSMCNTPELVSKLQPLWDPFAQWDAVHIDMCDVAFVWPCAITLLTTAIMKLRAEGFRVGIARPESEDVHNYLSRIDFYSLAGVEVNYSWRRHDPTGRFREVVQVCSEDEGEEVVRELMAILDRNVAGIAGVHDAVHHTFLEIVSNVFHHAQSSTHAVLCAQSYPSLQRVELAVVDSGRGIPASLRGNPELAGRFRNAAEAIELAVQPRTTGRPDYNSGEGLFFSLEFVKANGGKCCIHSQDGILWSQGGRTSSKIGGVWPGTWVGMQFRTDRPVDTAAIFNRYAPPDRDFDWLF